MCGACSGTQPAVHACRNCGEPVPGDGTGACRKCLTQEAIARKASRILTGLKQPSLRSLFERFAAWEDLPAAVGLQPARMDRYGAVFARLDAEVPGLDALDQQALIGLFGVDGLRRHHVPVGFLARETGIAWSGRLLEETAEHGRIAWHRNAWSDCPYADELDDYLDALQSRGLSKHLRRAPGQVSMENYW